MQLDPDQDSMVSFVFAGNYPCTCTSEKFNINDVKDLETELNQYWPSLNGPSDTFWCVT